MTVAESVTFVRDVQSQKVDSGTAVMAVGMVISLNDLQPSKTPVPSSVSEEGRVTFFRAEHIEKVLEPIEVTLGGISTFSKDSHE